MRIEQGSIVIKERCHGRRPAAQPLVERRRGDGPCRLSRGLGQPLEETIAAIESYEGKLSQLCLIEIDGQPVGEMSFGIGQNEANPGWKICETDYQNRGHGRKIIRMTFDYLFTGRG